MFFGRKLRTQLPELDGEKLLDGEERDHDKIKKSNDKTYADQKRHAKYSDLEVGDKVVVKQQLHSKTDTPFNATPFTLVSKRDNSCTIESNEGLQYKRNSTHVKKFLLPKTGESVSVSDVGDKNGRISKAVSQLIPPPETVSSHERPTSSDLAQSPNVHADTCSETAVECDDITENESKELSERPNRVRKMPKKFDDFIMN
ncbi:hypothetical protein RRG08_059606 [Elysia crispata]|uniref:Uncharacterized protein n=1 Tax=Elysia crispata TaxID=231223 RepID=A0AAE1AZ68_9GAST|nr:hypothetical protein RRG08_059606 [Elysia crispata]